MHSVAICLCSRRVFIYVKTQISKRVFQKEYLNRPQNKQKSEVHTKKMMEKIGFGLREQEHMHIYTCTVNGETVTLHAGQKAWLMTL